MPQPYPQFIEVAIKIQKDFVVDEFGYTAGVLPINAQSNVGLFVISKAVVNHNVCPSLQAIFNEFLNRSKFLFCYLCNKFSQRQSALIGVGIEVLCLVIPPVEFFELYPVFSKLNRAHLGR